QAQLGGDGVARCVLVAGRHHRPHAPGQFGAVRFAAVEEVLALPVGGPAVERAHHRYLGGGQAAGVVGAGRALDAGRVEGAGPRVGDDAMRVGAGRHDRGVQGGQLLRGEDLVTGGVHVDLGEPGFEQAGQGCPVVGLGAGEDAVEIGGVPLGQVERLVAAVGDAVEVGVGRPAPVEGVDDRLGGDREAVLGAV